MLDKATLYLIREHTLTLFQVGNQKGVNFIRPSNLWHQGAPSQTYVEAQFLTTPYVTHRHLRFGRCLGMQASRRGLAVLTVLSLRSHRVFRSALLYYRALSPCETSARPPSPPRRSTDRVAMSSTAQMVIYLLSQIFCNSIKSFNRYPIIFGGRGHNHNAWSPQSVCIFGIHVSRVSWHDNFHQNHGYAAVACPTQAENKRIVDYPPPFWLNLFHCRKHYMST